MLSSSFAKTAILVALICCFLIENVLAWITLPGGAPTLIYDRGGKVCSDVLPFMDGSNHVWLVCSTFSDQNNIQRVYKDLYSDTLRVNKNFIHGTSLSNTGAIDTRNGDLYVAGVTYENWGGQTVTGAGTSDAFIFKVNSAGTVQWTTYLGTSGYDGAYSISVDQTNDRVVMTGFRSSGTATPATSPTSAYFLAAFSTSTGALAWNTNVRTGNSLGRSVVVANGFVYSCGQGSQKAFWYKHNLGGGSSLASATHAVDSECLFVDYDSSQSVVVSSGWIKGQMDTWNVYGGGRDAFVTYFNPSTLARLAKSYTGWGTEDADGNGVHIEPSRSALYLYGDFTPISGTENYFVRGINQNTLAYEWETSDSTVGTDTIYRMRSTDNKAIVWVGIHDTWGFLAISSCSAGRYAINGINCQLCAPGLWSTYGAASCTIACSAGYFCAGDGNRVQCAAGTWAAAGSSACNTSPAGTWSDVGAASPTNCDAGTFSTATGAISIATCLNCAAGRWSNAGSSTCSTSLCITGHYCTGNGVMTPCAAGTASSATGATSSATCITCSAGKWSAAGTATCTNCVAGTWVSTAGAASAGACTAAQCTAGSFCAGNGIIATCPAGTWSAAGSSACTSCAAGTSSSATSATSIATCVNCSPGSWSNAGSSTCSLACTAGSYCIGGVKTICPAGTWSAAGASTCSKCVAGTWVSATGSTASTACTTAQCLAGSFCAGDGIIATCPAGTWSAAGSASCTNCAAGTSSAVVSATSNTVCTTCVAGTWSTAGATVCTSCAAGNFSSALGATSISTCTNCPAGSWSAAGASACTICSPGTFSSSTGGASSLACVNCQAGSWSASGASICTQCQAGKFSSTVGATSISSCLNCAAGSWSSPGASSCIAGTCPAGNSCAGDGTSSPCVAGTFSLAGSSACTNCASGTWSDSGSASCSSSLCLAGSYCAGDGTNLPCPSGTYSLSGSASCDKCKLGSIVVDNACVECEAGTYSADGRTCQPCTIGHFSLQGSSSCKACDAGYFTNNAKSCSQCPENTFSAAGSGKCTECEQGTRSNPGDSSCSMILSAQLDFGLKTKSAKKAEPTGTPDALSDGAVGGSLQYLYIIAGLVFVLIVIAVLFVLRMNRKPSKRTTEVADALTEQTSTALSNQLTSMAHRQIVGMTNITATMVADQPELSIPSFLCKDVNLDYKIGQQIAAGGLANIYACQASDFELVQRSEGAPLIIKISGDNLESLKSDNRFGFYQELSLMWLLREHPHIAKVFGYSNAPAGIIMKFYAGGDLDSYVTAKSSTHLTFPYTPLRVIVLMKQVASAIGYMHYLGIAHSDVKPQNVLLEVTNSNGYDLIAVISDLGISRVLDGKSLNVVHSFHMNNLKGASIFYAAPEAMLRLRSKSIENNPHVWKASDTFALAVCLLRMMNRAAVWPKNGLHRR